MIDIKKSEEQKELEENPKDSIRKQVSIFAKILYIYSNLMEIIDEFKYIKLLPVFINRAKRFQKIMKKEQSNISIIEAYNKLIFSECEKGSNVSKEIIEIFKHMANSYLISEIIKNNLEDSFSDYLNGLIKINKEKINDVNLIFNEEEYIYFPKLTDEDIIYCFSYGFYNYKCGALNPTEIPVNLKDNEKDKINREKILINLKENFKKEKIKDNHLKLLDGYFSKINHLYNKIKN